MISGAITSWQRHGVTIFFLGLQNHCRQWLQPWNKKMLAPWKENYDKARKYIKKQRNHFANKDLYSWVYDFSSSHVWIWEVDHKEDGVLKNWYFRTMLVEKTLESPLDNREIKPVNPNGNQPWIFTGNTDAEAEALILWPPDKESQQFGKDSDSVKDWRQGMTENDMVVWHDWLNGHKFEGTPGDNEGQGSPVCCSPWGRKELDTT